MPGRAQNTFLVQEVIEEEWNALQSMEGCPEALAQLEQLMDLAVLEEVQQELIDQGDLWEWAFLPISRCSNADLFSEQLVLNSPSSTSICSQVSRSLFLL